VPLITTQVPEVEADVPVALCLQDLLGAFVMFSSFSEQAAPPTSPSNDNRPMSLANLKNRSVSRILEFQEVYLHRKPEFFAFESP